MNPLSLIRPWVPAFAREFYLSRFGGRPIDAYDSGAATPEEIRADIARKYRHDSALLDVFANHQGVVVHKWHHYIPLYDRYLSGWRGKQVRFLEIGVSKGGSLQMWRRWLGPEAVIFGIDINPECRHLDGQSGQVRIGSQTDARFLESVVSEMGGLDVVLDDGSHHMDHVAVTLKHLFRHLSPGGTYMVEDLHTAYWSSYGGGYRSRANFFSHIGELVDDMHHWYHPNGMRHAEVSRHCVGVHLHDSVAVLEKGETFPPVHSRVGQVEA